MTKTAVILQSNYIPWKGYFDMMNRADAFVIYDHVQYTKDDWRNRNQIKTKDGPLWLTIPIRVKGLYPFPINQAQVADKSAVRKHWRTIQQTYARAPHFDGYRDLFEAAYNDIRQEPMLSKINHRLLLAVRDALGVTTSIHWDSEFEFGENKTGKLVSICQQLGADTYLSGPAAKAYMDMGQFDAAGIAVKWMTYDGYPAYEQPYPPFEHGVSVLDLIFSTGPNARDYMLSF